MLGVGSTDAVKAALPDVSGMFLDAPEQIEGGARTCAVAVGLQAHSHDAVENERQEADHGMGANAIGKPVMDGRDLDVGLQNAEATLDTP